MAVFQIQHTDVNPPRLNDNDEIMLFQIRQYVSSNEDVWHIFGFPNHERDKAVIHLTVHLEKGQREFFTNETAIERAMNPPKTTFTKFFELCNRAHTYGAFARTLLYHAISHGIKQKNGCPASKTHQ